jgi:hypothetical protein
MTTTSLPAPNQLALTTVAEDFRALQVLGLDDGPDVEDLNPPPTAQDRRLFKVLQHTTPALVQNMTVGTFKAKRINVQIIDAVAGFLTGKSSLIGHLGADVFASASADQLRATPSVFLQRMLSSVEAQYLADRLLKTLKWYGAHPGEQTPASVRHQLVCKAICLYLHSPSADEPQELAGFRWQDPVHWGKSYQTLRSDFEQHLLRTKRVANAKEAILLARVFETRLSKDFAVRDIPPDLPYKSSVVWVNFMHGVLLADELGLNRSQPLSFQQFVDLPLNRSISASPDQLETIARLRLIPALEWAVCNGIVQAQTASDYAEEDIQQALTALQDHIESLSNAVTALDLPPPERLKMAKRAKDELFGGNSFESDGRRLLLDVPSAYTGAKSTPLIKRPGFTLLDLYADGRLDSGQKWFVTQSDGKTPTSHWIRIDDKRTIHSEREDHYGNYRQVHYAGKTLPDVSTQFETDFKNYLLTIRPAYQTLIASLLASLPLADRQALEWGNVRLLSLRQETKDIIKEHETAALLMPLRARKGFVLQVAHDQKITFYELIPCAGVIRCRTDLTSLMVGGQDATAEFEG